MRAQQYNKQSKSRTAHHNDKKKKKMDYFFIQQFRQKMLRSTCGAQWMDQTRRTPAWRSTSAGR